VLIIKFCHVDGSFGDDSECLAVFLTREELEGFKTKRKRSSCVQQSQVIDEVN
jgi:hypothetical protein